MTEQTIRYYRVPVLVIRKARTGKKYLTNWLVTTEACLESHEITQGLLGEAARIAAEEANPRTSLLRGVISTGKKSYGFTCPGRCKQ